jgi:hypothetical protein
LSGAWVQSRPKITLPAATKRTKRYTRKDMITPENGEFD